MTIKKAEDWRNDAFELWCWKRLLSPLNYKIKPVSPKRNQSWVLTGSTDAEAETPIVWPPYVKNWLTGKDLYDGKDWGQEEKGTTEDEMVGWHHQLNGHEFEQECANPMTGKPGMLQSMGSQRGRHNGATELTNVT